MPFPLGRIVATPGALALLEEYRMPVASVLSKHAQGDWGVTCPEDRKLNDAAVIDGDRILSVYELVKESRETRVWIITEADRSSTCVLLPEEY